MHVAEGFYWDEPNKAFTHCYFNAISQRCTSLIASLSTRPRFHIGEEEEKLHRIFKDRADGAIILGKHTDKMTSREVKRSFAETSRAEPSSSSTGARNQQDHMDVDKDVSGNNIDLHPRHDPNKIAIPCSSKSVLEILSPKQRDTCVAGQHGKSTRSDVRKSSPNKPATVHVYAQTPMVHESAHVNTQAADGMEGVNGIAQDHSTDPARMDPSTLKFINILNSSGEEPMALHLQTNQSTARAVDLRQRTNAILQFSAAATGSAVGPVSVPKSQKGKIAEYKV